MTAPIRRVLAPNPGPMTLEGTNTWVVRAAGSAGTAGSVVVDPGPDDSAHLDRIRAVAGPIGVALITHRHADHTEGAPSLARAAGCPVRAVDPAFRTGDAGLDEGEEISAGQWRLRVLTTPGHTDDSVSLLLTGPGPTRLLTGDTVLGRGTTVIAAPDGDLAAYVASLQRLLRVVEDHQVTQILPGHGPVVEHPRQVLEHYLAHRRERLEQVRAAVAAGAVTAQQVVERVYAGVDRSLWPAATQSVEAQLRYLSGPD